MKKLLIALLFLPTLSWATASYGVFDFSSVEYQHSRNTDEVRSIASITKLFTAQTVLDSGVDLRELVQVRGKANGRFARDTLISRYELLRAMLMSSDNLAAETLAHAHPGGFDKFIQDVNTRVGDMALKNTVIVDSTGLLPGNKSTVDDLRDFLFTLRKYMLIQALSVEKTYSTEYRRGAKIVKVNLKNTNPQMWSYDNIVLTKTGFTNPAGRCLAMLVEKNGELFAVVSLGSVSVQERSKNIANLMNEIGSK
jgi:serine-type D-Ala-D-Ala endopeptidase (penicillin-binding protein 7)